MKKIMQPIKMLKSINRLHFLCTVFTILLSNFSFAEGTPSISPNSTTITGVLVAPDLVSGSYYNCSDDNRIYFNIANTTTENLYFGFDWRGYSAGAPARLTNLYYRIMNPDGTVAVPETLWNSAAGSAGSIDSYAQAINGPNIGSTTTGYTPIVFNPTYPTGGEFWIEFYRKDGLGNVDLGATGRANAALFDMTVANNSGAFTKRNGRVHCDKWGFVALTPSYAILASSSSQPSVYAYTNDQVVLRVSFNAGFKPIAYNLSLNSYGVNPVGAFSQTRKSINTVLSPVLPNGFKVFFNRPDIAVYPDATVPAVPTWGTPAITGCAPNYLINFNTSEAGDAKILLDLNGTAGYQASTADRIIEVTDLPAGSNTVAWDGLNGLGVLAGDGGQMSLTFNYFKGRFNLPLHDVEVNSGGFNVELVAPVAVANATMFWDDSELTNVGTSCDIVGNTTPDNNFGTGAGLNNSTIGTTSATGVHAWNGDGNLTQTIPAPAGTGGDSDLFQCNDFGNVRLINTWGYGVVSNTITTTIFRGCSDLRVVKTMSPASIAVGGTITFTITATNLVGSSNNTSVQVSDLLPSGYTITGTPSASVGSYNSITGIWTIGNLAANANATLTIQATVNASGIYQNCATISGANQEANASNNNSCVTPTIIPSFSINNASVIEGVAEVFTVSLSNPSAVNTVINVTTTNGSAVAPGDYTTTTTTVTIPAGSTSVTVSVPTIDDTTDEPDETFIINGTATSGNTSNTTASGTGTITDNDPIPSISIGNIIVPEGNNAVFTVLLSNPSSVPTTINVTSADGTAIASNDYTALTTTLVTIPAGSTSFTVSIPTINDTTDEPDETFILNGTVTSTNTTNTTPSGTATITDNDPIPSVSIGNITVPEGTNAVFTVALSNPSSVDTTINVATANGTAVSPIDYSAVPTTLVTIPAGSASVTVSVPTIDDTTDEPNETFVLNGTVTSTNTTNTTPSGTATITDNDPIPSVSIGNITVTEGDNAVFTVTLSNPSSVDTTINVATANGTAIAPGDYSTLTTTTITIPAGSTSTTVSIPTTNDSINEPIENFLLNGTVTSTNTSNTALTGSATINDDDGIPSISIGNITIPEGTNAVFTVSLSNPSSIDTTINVTTVNGTAIAPGDYISTTTTVTIPAGSTSITASVPTVDDTTDEPNETFNLNGTVTSTNTSNTTPSGTATITDNDPVPSVSIPNISVNEGNNAVFTVTLSNPSSVPTVIDVVTANVSAIAPGDYTTTTTTVTIPAGSTTVTVSVPTIDDLTDEPNESFVLNGTVTTTNTTNTTPSGTATITDNDPIPTVSIPNISVIEGNNAVFTVSLSNPSSVDTIINVTTANGTAIAPGDYTTTTTSVTIPAGSTSITATVPTIDDTIDEPNETFVLNGTVTTTNTSNTTPSGTATITDNDPTVSIGNVTVIEGVSAVFTITLSKASTTPVVINIATANGTAVEPNDYTTTITTVTIPAGSTSITVSVPTIDDTTNEPNETFIVNGTVTSNNTSNTNPSGIGTITDNDSVPSISIGNIIIPEGNNAVFNVTLSNSSSVDTTINVATANGTAIAPGDYTTLTTTLVTIPAGSLTVTVTVPTINDTTDEPNETFILDGTVTSTNTSNTTPSGIATITDNDPTPTVSIGNISVIEGVNAVFTVTLSNPSSLPTVIDVVTANGTAIAPGDYTTTTNTVTIPAGSTTVTVSVPTTDDTTDEPSETFVLNGTVTSTNTSNTTPSGTATITDNDPTPSVSIGNITVIEGDNAVFTVSLSNPSSLPTVIDVVTANGTATSPSDYTAQTITTVTIPAGSTTVTVSVPTTEDFINEPTENFFLNGTVTSINTSNTTATGTATITDDDGIPSVSIGDITVAEGTNAVFTISLSNPSSLPTTITVTTGNGTAIAPSDYITLTSTTVTIPAGSTSVTVSVPTIDDTTDEPNETFVLNGTVTSTNTSNTNPIGTATITDNDPTPTVSIPNITVNEGTNAVFTVTLSNPSSIPTVIDVVTTNASAIAPGDYTTTTTTVTIPAGSTTATVTVPTTDDTIDEPAETFTLNATVTSPNTSNTSTTGTATINDNDPAPTVSIGDITIPEGTNASFTVTLSNPSSVATVIDVVTANGTAIAPGDYTTLATTTVTIPAGSTTVTVSVPTIDDTTDEPSENFILNGTVTSLNTSNTTPSGTATITDNDPTPSVSIGNITVIEGDNAVFTVTLSNPSSLPTVINVVTANGTATSPSDYTAQTTTTITIPAGSTTATITVPTTEDFVNEPTETFFLNGTVSSTNTSNTTATGTATITDDDGIPTISIGDITVTEGNNAVFTVSLSNPSSVATTINVATANGTAIAPSDYTAQTTTLVTIPAGSTSVTVSVPTIDDTTDEPNETFVLNGTVTSTNTSNTTPSGTATITDNDPTPTVSIPDITVTEGTNAVFTVTLSNPSSVPTVIDVVTTNASAIAPGDYTITTTTVTIPAGSTTANVSVPTTDDTIDEPAETFTLNATVTSPNTSNTSATGTATINDNDPAPTVSIGDITIPEGTNASFTVTLSNPSSVITTINVSTANGTAIAPGDYTTLATTTVTIPAGSTTVTVSVPTIDDTTDEPSENFILNGTVTSLNTSNTTPFGTATITDNDPTPSVSIGNITVNEGDSAVFTVTLSNPSSLPTVINVVTANGTATSPSDYTAQTTATITIPAGSTTATVTVPTTEDLVNEPTENFFLNGTVTSTNTSNTTATGTATITDDDGIPSISIGDITVTEGTNAVFTVALSNPSSVATTINVATANGTGITGAVAPGDYTAQTTTLVTIPAGSTTVTVSVPTIDDTTDEPNENFVLNGTVTSTNTSNTTPSGTATITDNDPAPSIIIDDASIIEGGSLSFLVTLSNPSSTDITLNFGYTNITTSNTDYDITPASITITAGNTTGNLVVQTNQDIIDEPNETFSVAIISTTGIVGSTSDTAIGTIIDNDPTPNISINSVTVAEGANAVFTITLSNPSSVPTVVNITTANVSATTADYNSVSSTVTIPAGATTATVTVSTIDDIIDEPTETFQLNGTVTSGNTSNINPTAVGTITDNDASPTISISDVTVNEGSNAVFTISLSNPSSLPTVINVSTANGSANAPGDYTPVTSTTVTIPAGSTSITVPVTTIDDSTDEPSENFTLTGNVTSGNTLNNNPTGTATINDNDPIPSVSIGNITVTEGTPAVFTISLSNPSSLPTIINVSTANLSAIAPGDYTTVTTTTVTIPAGSTSITVPVTTIDDTINEPNEQFVLNGTITSTNTTNTTIVGTATITDNDGIPTFSISNPTVVEGGNAVFTVSLSNPSSTDTVITVVTNTGTAGTSDYTTTSTTITISAGSTSATVSVPTTDDTMDEPDETFTLNGTVTSGNTTNTTTTGTATITDNDLAPTVTINNLSVNEGANAVFTVTLSNPSSVDTVINVSTANGTATTLDYTSVSSSITIPAGEVSATVSVATINDTTDEPDETFILNGLVTSGNTTNTNPFGTATILDNDLTPTISISDVTANEGSDAVFTITLSNPSSVDTVINITTNTGTAGTADYTSVITTITIPAGSTSITVNVPTTEDTIDEPSENFTLTGTVTSGNTNNNNLTGTGTITDNDPTPTISINNVDIIEGNTGIFTVSLSNPSSVNTIVNVITNTGTAGLSDYTAVNTSVTIPAGSTSVTVNVTTLEDTINEPNEQFTLNGFVTTGNTSNNNPIGTGTIIDNDGLPSVLISNVTVIEGSDAIFTVSLSNPSSQPTVINIVTTTGTAGTADYNSITTVVTIPAGSTSVTVPVQTIDDLIDEPSETFTLNGTITSGNTNNTTAFGTATINDNDLTPTISISDVSVVEGNNAIFNISLSNPSSIPTVINITTTPGSASTLDYTSVTTTITIPAGVTSTTVTVQTTTDLINELTETFTLNGIVTSGNTTNSTPLGTGTITDNDLPPNVIVDDASITEGGTLTFPVTLSNPSYSDITLTFAFTNITTSNSDYVTSPVTITIPAGATTGTVNVITNQDLIDEPNETFSAAISSSIGTLGNTSDTAIGTIIDNDPTPTVIISDNNANEGSPIVFTVSLSNPSSVDTVINITTTTGTAGTDDYTSVTTTVTIPAGSTSVTIPVQTIEDSIDEPNETFTLNGAITSGNTSNTTALGTGTINDNDNVPTISINNVTATEGTNEVFTVSLSNPSSLPTVITISTANGTATNTDYTAVSTTVTIPAGSTSVTVSVPTLDDSIYEISETFTLNGTVTSGNTSNTTTSGTGTITDNDPIPTVAINNVTVVEGVSAIFTVSLSNPSSTDTVIDIVTTPGTATTADYTSVFNTITIPAGSTTMTVTVPTTDDLIDEPSENFTLVGNITAGNTSNTSATGTGTITDNDPTPTIAISSPSTTEGQDAIFTVSLTNPSSVDTVINIVTNTGTAGTDDYTSVTTTITIPAGSTSTTVNVSTTNDTMDEPNETFTLNGNVTSGNTSNTNTSGTGTIEDNDATPTISINNVSTIESNGMIFTISLSNPSNIDTVINLSTTTGTAGLLDYTSLTSTVTIPAGATSLTVTIPTLEDLIDEIDETFTLNGTVTSANTSNTSTTGTGTIVDNDGQPTVLISDITVNEGSDAIFTVSLSNPSSVATIINVTTNIGSADLTDYTTVTTTVTIPAGATSATVTVPTINDNIDEPNETFTLTGAVTTGNTNNTNAIGTATIIDNDVTPTIAINNVTTIEGSNAIFTISLSNPSSVPTVINVTTATGTASTDDYTTITTTVTIPAGVTSATVNVPTTNDTIDEPDETFTLNGTVTSGNTINGNASGTGTITDNDPIPTISISDASVTEGGNEIFTITLTNASSVDTVINLTTTTGTAISPADYTPIITTLIIPAGATSGTVTVLTIDDLLFESTETFILNGTVTSNNTANTNPFGTGTILDNDSAPTLSISNVTVTEGGDAVFTVSLNTPSTTDTVINVTTATGTAGTSDYTTVTTTVTIPAGSTSVTVPVPTTEDNIDEPSENFTLIGTVTSGTTFNPTATGTATITDNDPTPVVTINNVTTDEGSVAVFTVSLSNPSSTPITIDVITTTGTAGTLDYTSVTTTVTIPAGSISVTVPVQTTQDLIDEPSETFTLNGSVTSGNATSPTSPGTGTIVDNDPAPTVTINNVTAVEGSNEIFTISLSNPSSTDIVINLDTNPGTASILDYTPATTTVTIPAGQVSISFSIPTTNDTIDELDETFTLNGTVTSGNTSNTNTFGTATITDDDPAPTFSITNSSITEGGSENFTVQLSNPSSQNIVIDVTTTIGTASLSDYTTVTTTVTIPAGSTSVAVIVPTIDDLIFEQIESLTLNGTLVSGTTSNSTAVGNGLINDNDFGPVITFGNVTVTEGGLAVFPVLLSNPSSTDVVISVTTATGTAGTADYTSTTTVITIPAGSTSTTVSVQTNEDFIDESDETFTLNGVATSGNTTGPNPIGNGTIIDNDGAPIVSINNVFTSEGNLEVFTISLSNPSSQDIVINLNTAPGTAIVSDYTSLINNTITIPAGSTSYTVNVATIEDDIYEADEQFNLNATVTSNNTSNNTATGIGTITNDDAIPTVIIGDYTVTEANPEIFTISLSNPSYQDVVINLSTSPNTASVLDYTSVTTTVTIPAGTTSITFNVPTTNDDIDEPSENFNLNGTVTSGNANNPVNPGIGTINDDDPTPVVFINSPTTTEGDDETFTVSLSNPSSTDVIINITTTPGTASTLDFTPVSIQITIPAGSTSVPVIVPTLEDTIDEPSEFFTLNGVVTSGNATNPAVPGTGTINDDDPTPTIFINNTFANENNDLVFTVSLSNSSSVDTYITVTTANGTGVNGAIAPDDYTPVTSPITVLIPAGSTSVNVNIPTIDDLIDEPNETMTLNGTVTSGNTSGTTAQGTGTIVDTDLAPVISINDTQCVEGASMTFLITLSIASSVDTVVQIQTNIGTAGVSDYTSISSTTITIPAGSTVYSATVPVQTTDDVLDETDETFTLVGNVLSGNTDNLSDSGTGTILDNDAQIIAVNDSNYIIDECTSSLILGNNILSNDLVDGNNANLSNVTLNVVPFANSNISVDPLGNISILNGVPAGTYTTQYTICERGNPLQNCATGTITITVRNTPLAWDTTVTPLPTTPIPASCDNIPLSAPLVAKDACGSINVTATDTRLNGTCANTYTLVRTWTITDSDGTVLTYVQTINVADTTKPVLTSVVDHDIFGVTCDAIPAPITPTFTDNCTVTIVPVLNEVKSLVDASGNYTITRTWTATDECLNVSLPVEQIVHVSVSNYSREMPLKAECNGVSSITFDMLAEIQKTYPDITAGGAWTDVDSSNGMDITTGIFSPFNIAVGDYNIRYVTNDASCPRVVTVKVSVGNDCSVYDCATLEFNNAITANNDGLNDFLFIDNITTPCYKENTVEIYNRWGVKVFETENYDNETKVFTGVSEGRSTVKQDAELPTGTYFYFIKYKLSDGTYGNKQGYLYLTR